MQVTKASIRRGLLFSASILALSGLGTAAHAQSAATAKDQTTTNDQTTAAKHEKDRPTLNEVVVTATGGSPMDV